MRETTVSNIHLLIVPSGLYYPSQRIIFKNRFGNFRLTQPTHSITPLKTHHFRTSKCIEILLFQSPTISSFIKHYFLCTSRPFVLSHHLSWYAIKGVNNFVKVTNCRLSTRLKALPRSLNYLMFVCWSP